MGEQKEKKQTRSVALTQATTGGNYFVSNYPPFNTWSTEQVGALDQAIAQPCDQADRPIGLYVHIPFCRKRCRFCYFKVYTDKNAKQIQAYLDAVLAEARLYAESALIQQRPLRFVYFGGGTPSYLSAKQLTYLTEGLKKILPWDQVEEVAFECEPGTLNEKKLHAIRQMGVTRLSFGIEDFHDTILETNGRAHLSKQVYAAYDWAQNVGFDQINIDLIAGMLEGTDETWQANIDQTLALAPDAVTIYQMEVPFNTKIYQQMKAEDQQVAPVADWQTKRRWVGEAFEQLEQAGYTVSSAYTAIKSPKTEFVYRDLLWHGADMLAVGVASFGHLAGVHYQNEKEIDRYVDSLAQGVRPVHRALAISREEALIREMILQMKLGWLDVDYFQNKFNVDILKTFAPQWQALLDESALTIADRRVELTRQTLLRVDSILPPFFLPAHGGLMREGN